MQGLKQENIEKVDSFNGIDIYLIKTGKFKTSSINVFFHDNLTRENAAKNALLPAVLRRGCRRFPTLKEISLYLEELYGASFDCGVTKKGETQIVQFYIEHVSDVYAGSRESLFKKCFGLLYDIVTDPVLEGDSFRKDYVEQEKENLRLLIEGRINDKVQYAVDRCFEEMCSGEPFGVYEYGTTGDVAKINAEELYRHYRALLTELPISVYITGDVDSGSIAAAVEKLKQLERGNIKKLNGSDINAGKGKSENITEKLSVNQSKLTLGFRTRVSPTDPDYYSLLVYNGILGGGLHSKLFQNVREKESLAYYIFSRLEKFKGLMVISSGIEAANRQKAYDIIIRQMEEIRSGNITDYEYESTLKSYESGIKALRDSQMQIVDFYLSQLTAGTEDNFESVIEKMKSVSKQDVAAVAGKIELDAVYFLTGNAE